MRHTAVGVRDTPWLVCETHYSRCARHTAVGVRDTLYVVVCIARQKRCAYREHGSTPYLVCHTHQTFYSVVMIDPRAVTKTFFGTVFCDL